LAALGALVGLGGLVAVASPAHAADLPTNCAQTGSTVTCTYSYTAASQTFTVPDGITSVDLSAWGGHGAPRQTVAYVDGGRGGLATGTFSVSPGDELDVTVASDGARPGGGLGLGNGGPGLGFGGGGGGGSAISHDGTLLLVAGGGGGAGLYDATCAVAGTGGDAGQDGHDGGPCLGVAGAPGGKAGQAPGHDGLGAAFGTAGGSTGGGGGGGGFLGGTGGQGAAAAAGGGGTSASGGGGGTSYAAPSGTGVSLSGLSGRGYRSNGLVTIAYQVPDGSGPVDAPVLSPVANDAGWNRSDVSVEWNWTDAGSGVDAASCQQQSSSSGEGTQSLSSSCSDLNGNSSTDSVTVQVDKTAPVDAPEVTMTSTGASVAWNWSDALSGVDAANCTQSSSQTGTGQLTFTSSCTDVAGNTATDSKTVTVTPPPTKADIQEKITGPATGKKGTTYTYTVTTKNVGPAAAADVGTTLLLPGDASVVSVSGSYAKIGPLVVWRTTTSKASGASLTYTVKVKFNGKGYEPLAVGAASLRTPDPDLRNNAAVVTTKIS
jgi:uncharacterized repeat protein (TIGR01451 family)